MRPYATDAQFWRDYDTEYSRLIACATQFVQTTKAHEEDVIVLIRYAFLPRTHSFWLM